mmetsp:Transcript_87835/g.120994  ORF Transcript_87835/g.120994 Transcript_87835/m.120994 type:complete len:278 (-) Transcript_87835:2074-2907(-)
MGHANINIYIGDSCDIHSACFNLRALSITDVYVNGEMCPQDKISFAKNKLKITLDNNLKSAWTNIQVAYLGKYTEFGESKHKGTAFVRYTDPADQKAYLYSQFAMNNTREVFPCSDVPTQSARIKLNVLCQKDWKCISNTLETRHESVLVGAGLRNLEKNGTDFMLDFFKDYNNVCLYEFEQTKPLRSHSLALFAGPFEMDKNFSNDASNSLPMRIFYPVSQKSHFEKKHNSANDQKIIKDISEKLECRYPFDKLDHVIWPRESMHDWSNMSESPWR